jgi:two-component system LytT family response regulator
MHLDYLLKPFDRERFERALERAKLHIQRAKTSEAQQQLLALLEEVKPGRKPLDRVVLRSSGRVFFLRVEEIDWIEAAGNYLRLHAGTETHLLRETMNAFEERLDPKQFLRIHRSMIVNIERIQELQPLFHGDYAVLLRDGTQLTLSRTYRQRLGELFGENL